MLKKMGFIAQCECGNREKVYGLAVHINDKCSLCGREYLISGPMWLGELHEPAFCDEIIEEMEQRDLGTKEMSVKMLEFCRDELSIPMFYDQHLLCKKLGVSASTIDTLITALRDNGYKASRTHFSGTSFKTDAELPDIERIIVNIR